MCNKYFKNSLIPETKASLAAMLEEPTWFFFKENKIVINIPKKGRGGWFSHLANVFLDPSTLAREKQSCSQLILEQLSTEKNWQYSYDHRDYTCVIPWGKF